MNSQRRWLLVLIVPLVIAAGLALYWLFDGFTNVEALQLRIASLGPLAPAGYVFLYTIATLLMIPGGVFDLAGGALFGPVWGTVFNLAGVSLGAAIAFLIARYVAGDWVRERAGPRVQSVIRSVETDGWQFVAFIRLVPVFPYPLANYLLGLTRIPFAQYMLATIICALPSTIAYTWVGYVGRSAVSGHMENIRYALFGIGLLAIVLMGPRLYKMFRKSKAAAAASAPAEDQR
jgi:uncharacterized membrane protein YdjX (TVP38/TMEM64 family)